MLPPQPISKLTQPSNPCILTIGAVKLSTSSRCDGKSTLKHIQCKTSLQFCVLFPNAQRGPRRKCQQTLDFITAKHFSGLPGRNPPEQTGRQSSSLQPDAVEKALAGATKCQPPSREGGMCRAESVLGEFSPRPRRDTQLTSCVTSLLRPGIPLSSKFAFCEVVSYEIEMMRSLQICSLGLWVKLAFLPSRVSIGNRGSISQVTSKRASVLSLDVHPRRATYRKTEARQGPF